PPEARTPDPGGLASASRRACPVQATALSSSHLRGRRSDGSACSGSDLSMAPSRRNTNARLLDECEWKQGEHGLLDAPTTTQAPRCPLDKPSHGRMTGSLASGRERRIVGAQHAAPLLTLENRRRRGIHASCPAR